MKRTLIILSSLLLLIGTFSSCAISTGNALQQDNLRRDFMRLGTLDIEQFELSAVAYREGATSRSGSTATGGCGCN